MITRFYLDFDGTLTGREGSACVSSDFYQDLQLDPRADYSYACFRGNMVDLIKTGLALPENKTMRMSEGALSFLKTMLTQGADINIVSRNRKEYIKAVLLAEGMEAELIQKITICDANDLLLTGKYQAVVDLEKSKKAPAGVVIICDDNSMDCKAMTKAVKDNNDAKTTVISHSEFAGTFDWQKIARDAPQPTKPTTITAVAESYTSAQDWEDLTEMLASRKTEKIQKQYEHMKTKPFCLIPFDDDDCYLPKRKPAKFIDRLVALDQKKQDEIIQAQAHLPEGKRNLEDIQRMLNVRVKYKTGDQPTPYLLNLVHIKLDIFRSSLETKAPTRTLTK